MSTKSSIRKGMNTVLGIFLGILIYKAIFYSLKEAFLFLPLVVIGLVATIAVHFFTKERKQSGV